MAVYSLRKHDMEGRAEPREAVVLCFSFKKTSNFFPDIFRKNALSKAFVLKSQKVWLFRA